MNPNENLVLIKGQDRTESVRNIQSNLQKINVTFENNKTFSYNRENVKWLRQPNVQTVSTSQVFVCGKLMDGAVILLKFGSHSRILFKSGYKKVCLSHSIQIIESELQKPVVANTFSYLKMLSTVIDAPNEIEKSFLEKQYERLQFIHPKSVLAHYLKKHSPQKIEHAQNYIYPFSFNLSQKTAVEHAFTNHISIIEGPPGTGKTQTILNIIANAIVFNQSVAVVSNNNSATDNVVEKLQKYGLHFLVATLGNQQKQTAFFNKIENYPDMTTWKRKSEEIQHLKTNLASMQHMLNQMLELRNTKAKLSQELETVEREYQYFDDLLNDEKPDVSIFLSLQKLTSNQTLRLLNAIDQLPVDSNLSIWRRIIFYFKYKLFHSKKVDLRSSTTRLLLQQQFYLSRMKELKVSITKIENQLSGYQFKEKMDEYSALSMQLLHAKLYEVYSDRSERPAFTKDVLWKNFSSLVKEYPIVTSTTHSLKQSSGRDFLFDYVLIDESSQVDLVSGALALSAAKRTVIVGDQKQLPNVVTQELKEKTDAVFHSFQISSAFRYSENSLLQSIRNVFVDAPVTLLREHYRSHPQIIEFCNQRFYNNELIILTEQLPSTDTLLLVKTGKGNHARGTFNQRQIEVISTEILPQIHNNQKNMSIGIISPFREQANKLKQLEQIYSLEADTVHKFQGREKNIIILSTVVNTLKANDFADDAHLINVAISRAVNQLIVVTADESETWAGTYIGDLIRYIRYNNFEVRHSELYSIFDYLYSSLEKERKVLLAKQKKVSTYDSENLTAKLLDDIIKNKEFSFLSISNHPPLRMLIKERTILTQEERKYVENSWTHLDFVMFNKIDKTPVLIVEVDGYSYHKEGTRQAERDRMKDSILAKYKLPIIRLSTTGSNERKLIEEKLKTIIQN